MNQTRLHQLLASKELKDVNTAETDALFSKRLAANSTLIQHLYFQLYPEATNRENFRDLLKHLPVLFNSRPRELKVKDLEQLKKGDWHQSEKIVGMQLYVDHFNKNLKGLLDKLDYFEALGINFLHLMPLTTRPKQENDGGYAVNSYTAVDRRYGSAKDLQLLTEALRSRGIYLMLDFVVNHTSNEFPWAKKAAAGSRKYQEYYYTYPDRTVPDAFEATLPEVFPQTSPGNFTYVESMDRWVMTVFNSFQWDLNYTRPEVFKAMLTELVKLTNLGVDVVRFDALAFLWKKLGTISQNLPEAHTLISLFRMCLQVVCPGVVILAEAIVAPRDIIKYFGEGITEGNECDLAYNATLMALLWNSIATKKTSLLYKNLENLPGKPEYCSWINYVRCHDDIGLGFEDRYIYDLGWEAPAHRRFLLEYYSGQLPWSPATGQVFMYNPRTGDGRITGSAASLLGLEKALNNKDPEAISEAINKIVLLYGIVLSYGGIPLIYSGDEWGALNDYTFLSDPAKKSDTRWLNRPRQDWKVIATLDEDNPASRIFGRLKELIALRKKSPVLRDGKPAVLIDSGNPHLLAYIRDTGPGRPIMVVANFDQASHGVKQSFLMAHGFLKEHSVKDKISGEKLVLENGIYLLPPYHLLWLEKP